MAISCKVLSIAAIFQVTSVLQCTMVVNHVKVKSPSATTVIDYVISDTGLMIIGYHLVTGMCMSISMWVTMPEVVTLATIVVARFIGFLTAFHWLAKCILKYCYIFHWGFMMDLCDVGVIFTVRLASVILSLGFMLFELHFVLDERPLLYYPVGHSKQRWC